jgi:hypothetical protein
MAANMRLVNSSAGAAICQLVGRSSATTRTCLASSPDRSLRRSPSVKRDKRSTCSTSNTSPGLESARRRNSSAQAQSAHSPQDFTFGEFPQGMAESSALGSFGRWAVAGAVLLPADWLEREWARKSVPRLAPSLAQSGLRLVNRRRSCRLLGGGAAVQKGQDWLISKLPE